VTWRLELPGVAKPGETHRLMGTDTGFARQEAAGQVFGQFWNRTEPFIRSNPRPLPCYPDPLLTLPTTLRQWQAATELGTCDCATSDVNGYEGDIGDDADSDEVEDKPQTDDRFMQISQHWGHRTSDWGHGSKEFNNWTVYFRPVRYDNGKANAMASNVSEAKSVL
jgi:hypothetical protein